jgi:hypothetical protein
MAAEMSERRRCSECGRLIFLSRVASDVHGRPVLVWHYNNTGGLTACRGALKATYDDEPKEAAQ